MISKGLSLRPFCIYAQVGKQPSCDEQDAANGCNRPEHTNPRKGKHIQASTKDDDSRGKANRGAVDVTRRKVLHQHTAKKQSKAVIELVANCELECVCPGIRLEPGTQPMRAESADRNGQSREDHAGQ